MRKTKAEREERYRELPPVGASPRSLNFYGHFCYGLKRRRGRRLVRATQVAAKKKPSLLSRFVVLFGREGRV